MRIQAVVALIGAGGLVLSACAGAVAPAEGKRIEIEMKSFSFSPSAVRLEPGEKITLVLRNPDSVEHEFMAGREPLKDGGFKDDLLGRLEIEPKPQADHGQGHGAGVAVMVQPGQTRTLTLVAPSAGGVFEFACFLPGHYEGGMKGALTIGAPAPAQATGAASPAATAASTSAPSAVPTAAPRATPARSAAPSGTDEHAGEGH